MSTRRLSQQRLGIQRSGVAQRVNMPAPFGGWNTRDAQSAMPASDALILDNLFPATNRVRIRKGYEEWVTGLTGEVETLAEYHAGTQRKLFAGSGGSIYDVTLKGAPSSVRTGFNNNRWQYVNFNAHLLMFNGQDEGQTYNGSSWSDTGFTGSGLDTSDVIGINIFKNRVYVWERDSQDFWYGGVAAVQGTLTKFPLSRVAQFGGNLIAMATWTRDGGDGMDDLAVFFMSSGQTIVYQGSDPGLDFSLIGIFNLGGPLSIRGVVRLGGDVAIMMRDDFVLLSNVLSAAGVTGSESKLSGAASEAARLYGNNYGWQALHYPLGNMIIFNVPLATNNKYHQYVVNTITGAPCRFTGMNARCWGLYNNRLYFGGNQKVYIADEGTTDDGNAIEVDGMTAYSNFGQQSEKHIKLFIPILDAEGDLSLTAQIGLDHKLSSITQSVTSTPQGTPWDTSDWDTSDWSPEDKIRDNAYAIGGTAADVALRLTGNISGQEIAWYRTDYFYETIRSF